MTVHIPHVMEKSPVAQALKEMRNEAGLTVREIADKLGWPHTTYATYEGRYKGRYLPIEKARAIADVLHEHGIDKDRVLALAGVESGHDQLGEAQTSPHGNLIPVDYIEAAIEGLVELLNDRSIKMPAAKQARMVATFCRWYSDEVLNGNQPSALSGKQAKAILGLLLSDGS